MSSTSERLGLSRAQMAWAAAQDVPDQAFVNLGIGMPERVADFVPEGRRVTYHSENGMLGFGPLEGEADYDLVNAGKKAVSLLPGASLFHHADSFAMIRGGHIDVAILGAFQIAPNGDLANWKAGNDAIPAVGGAMDLVSGAREVWCVTDHTTRDGLPKLVEACTYPLTGIGVVTRIYTSLAVVHVRNGRFVATALARGVDFDTVRARTGAKLEAADDLALIDAPALG